MLKALVAEKQNWTYIAEVIGTKTGRQCRVRSAHALNPLITLGPWSAEVSDDI